MPEFKYQDPFPLGKDTTKYRLLTKDYVKTAEFVGEQMLKVDPEGLTFLANQARMSDNASRFDQRARGAPRSGDALLVGLVVCGRCGRQMRVAAEEHVVGVPDPAPGVPHDGVGDEIEIRTEREVEAERAGEEESTLAEAW